MKTQEQIEQAAKVLAGAAVFSLKANEKDLFEVASTAVQILGWVLDQPDSHTNVEVLLDGAKRAQQKLLNPTLPTLCFNIISGHKP